MSGTPFRTGSALTTGFAVLLASAALTTVAGGTAAHAERKSTANDPSRRVCRVITPTSSRLTTRVCRTQAEWDQSAREAQESALNHQFDQTRNGAVAPAGGGPVPR